MVKDNITKVKDRIVSACFKVNRDPLGIKIGTLLSTVDDLLMNIKIAEDTQYCAEEI